MKSAYLFVTIIGLFSFSCTQSQQLFLESKNAYFGLTPPGLVPEIFAPGFVSDSSWAEHCQIAISPDGKEIYWSAWTAEYKTEDGKKNTEQIFYSHFESGKWSKPELAEFVKENPYGINGGPVFSPDGKRLFFYQINSPWISSNMNTYYIEKKNNKWSTIPIDVGQDYNTNNQDYSPIFAGNNTAYKNLFGKIAQYTYENNKFTFKDSIVIHEGFSQAWNFYMSPDEDYIIFADRQDLGYGDLDLYISFKSTDNKWGKPINMGDKINTSKRERFPMVSPDGKYMFFMRHTETQDIFWVSTKIFDDLRENELSSTNNQNDGTQITDSLSKSNENQTNINIDFITVNEFNVEVLITGLDNYQDGKPTVVFENGMASTYRGWETVAEEISKTHTVFRYNRPRIGKSENDSLPPTTEHIVSNLRKMLLQKGLEPPYLLVSHSFGGAYIRKFASMYPDEIAGLVFVDPVDFTQKKGDGDLPYLEIGLSQHQIDSIFAKPYDDFIEKLYEEMPEFYVEEVKILRSLYASEFKECVCNPFPDVPVHFIMAGGYTDDDDRGETIFDKKELFRIDNNLKMKRWIALLDPLKFGKFFYCSNSGHFVMQDDPEVVITSIKLALEDYNKIKNH